MSSFDHDSVQDWRPTRYESPFYEEQPYRECPNCSRFKFRAVREYRGGWLFGERRTEYIERCKNCNYKGEEWTEK